ncbi:MAG: GNAT family N-acetyltransferase [Saprospiraceae bacterium]|nr:GNAT family N-acetyltransferase [Saprospiraceae bacterium]MCF8249613.1 GNAT family N-acetyltransferase [Saprospiraceae bacterium]MCF8280423.1 GNAT family N-acetyltransferase [Bacteroidales bacterium]MCF8310445.1 GNAT family N-acetyltransferase [Saprospiraceae bacterium]MCF8439823.1 GNAT family N-acetyltransferase [Saprospiraceae bacterium]
MLLDNLTTDRLRFRPLALADKPRLMGFFEDPVATEFHFIKTDISEYADMWLRHQLGRYANDQGGLHAVELLETGELIGQAGLLYQWVDHVPKWEVGYHFFREHWGKGYATEAAQACRDFCFENEMAETLISLIHPDNLRSKAVAKRNGMTEWKRTTWRELAVAVYRIRRSEWETLEV